jgi:hypothetical protein
MYSFVACTRSIPWRIQRVSLGGGNRRAGTWRLAREHDAAAPVTLDRLAACADAALYQAKHKLVGEFLSVARGLPSSGASLLPMKSTSLGFDSEGGSHVTKDRKKRTTQIGGYVL